MSAHKINNDLFVVNGRESNDMGRASNCSPYRYSGIRPFLLWFCAWHPCYVLVYARSFEDALDEAIDASDAIPAIAALLRSGEEQAKEIFQEAYDAALAAGKDEDDAIESGWEAEEGANLTRAGNASEPFSSEEWGGSEPTREQILDLVAETNRRNSYLDHLAASARPARPEKAKLL